MSHENINFFKEMVSILLNIEYNLYNSENCYPYYKIINSLIYECSSLKNAENNRIIDYPLIKVIDEIIISQENHDTILSEKIFYKLFNDNLLPNPTENFSTIIKKECDTPIVNYPSEKIKNKFRKNLVSFHIVSRIENTLFYLGGYILYSYTIKKFNLKEFIDILMQGHIMDFDNMDEYDLFNKYFSILNNKGMPNYYSYWRDYLDIFFLLCLIKSTPSNYKTDNEFIRNRYSFVINKVLENEEAIKNKFYKYFTQYDDIDIYPIIGEKEKKGDPCFKKRRHNQALQDFYIKTI